MNALPRLARHRPAGGGPFLLVTGCPRSGTKYVSHILRALDRDVPHERMGRDGIATWCMAVEAEVVPWGPPRLPGESYEVTLHQVRNPRLAIPSMTTLRYESWRFVSAHVILDHDAPPLMRAAQMWYHWNLQVAKLANWRYRLEELPGVLGTFCEWTRTVHDPRVLDEVGTNVNTRAYSRAGMWLARACERAGRLPPRFLRERFVDRSRYEQSEPFSWSRLRAMDARVCNEVIDLAQAFGYTHDDLFHS